MAATVARRVVRHVPEMHKFMIELAGHKEAVLEYRLLPNAIIDMYHTETPPEYRGQGLAKRMTEDAFDYAIAHNLKVLPTCTYIQHYIKQLAIPLHKQQVVADAKL